MKKDKKMKLTPAQTKALRMWAGLEAPRAVRSDIEQRLTDLGLIERAPYGKRITDAGRAALSGAA